MNVVLGSKSEAGVAVAVGVVAGVGVFGVVVEIGMFGVDVAIVADVLVLVVVGPEQRHLPHNEVHCQNLCIQILIRANFSSKCKPKFSFTFDT